MLPKLCYQRNIYKYLVCMCYCMLLLQLSSTGMYRYMCTHAMYSTHVGAVSLKYDKGFLPLSLSLFFHLCAYFCLPSFLSLSSSATRWIIYALTAPGIAVHVWTLDFLFSFLILSKGIKVVLNCQSTTVYRLREVWNARFILVCLLFILYVIRVMP